ncbi:MAG: phosphoglucosamine mutase [Acidimicrobiia bacterium]|nr:phosphoglucosamine mutase [Acidimicrobiia bacterium]
MAKQLFGTDGIRGVAGEYPLDPQTVHAFGAALGRWCKSHTPSSQVLIGMDTRESGSAIAAQVAAGLALQGVRTRFAGLISTPGVAHLTKEGDFAAGVMISASHNPYQDNGLKLFSHSGYKLPDQEEHALEQEILHLRGQLGPSPENMKSEWDWAERYLDHLASTFPARLDGMHLAVDCGHGAATHLAPAVLERLGARVSRIGCFPNGRNINLDCGALHLETLSRFVLETGAAAGFAFDGDADRCIAVTASGRVLDGDFLMLICARHMRATGAWPRTDGPPTLVSTVMSNLGLEIALAESGIRMVRTAVGDKYVLEEMLRIQSPIGGEQSGHLIFSQHATTGDGLLTALRVLEVMAHTAAPLEELASGMNLFPQKLVNVRIKARKPLAELPSVAVQIQLAEKTLGADGRVLVRFSGTEPLARVMVEGPTTETVDQLTAQIASAIQSEIGG